MPRCSPRVKAEVEYRYRYSQHRKPLTAGVWLHQPVLYQTSSQQNAKRTKKRRSHGIINASQQNLTQRPTSHHISTLPIPNSRPT